MKPYCLTADPTPAILGPWAGSSVSALETVPPYCLWQPEDSQLGSNDRSGNLASKNVTIPYPFPLQPSGREFLGLSGHLRAFRMLSHPPRYLMKFLALLAEEQDVNKMTPSNIAIVLGPNLLWPPEKEG